MREGAISLGLLVTLLACNAGEEQAKKIRRVEDNPEALAELERSKATEAKAAAVAAPSVAPPVRRPNPLGGIYAKVANDAVEQYEIVKRNKGNAMELCAQAGMVTAAFLQAKDEANYRAWKVTEKKDCARAGVP